MSAPFHETIAALPQLPQRQDALNDQLRDLAVVANKLGLYDAATYIQDRLQTARTRPWSK